MSRFNVFRFGVGRVTSFRITFDVIPRRITIYPIRSILSSLLFVIFWILSRNRLNTSKTGFIAKNKSLLRLKLSTVKIISVWLIQYDSYRKSGQFYDFLHDSRISVSRIPRYFNLLRNRRFLNLHAGGAWYCLRWRRVVSVENINL